MTIDELREILKPEHGKNASELNNYVLNRFPDLRTLHVLPRQQDAIEMALDFFLINPTAEHLFCAYLGTKTETQKQTAAATASARAAELSAQMAKESADDARKMSRVNKFYLILSIVSAVTVIIGFLKPFYSKAN